MGESYLLRILAEKKLVLANGRKARAVSVLG